MGQTKGWPAAKVEKSRPATWPHLVRRLLAIASRPLDQDWVTLGNSTQNRLPWPGSESRHTAPPICCTTLRTTARTYAGAGVFVLAMQPCEHVEDALLPPFGNTDAIVLHPNSRRAPFALGPDSHARLDPGRDELHRVAQQVEKTCVNRGQNNGSPQLARQVGERKVRLLRAECSHLKGRSCGKPPRPACSSHPKVMKVDSISLVKQAGSV